VGRARNPKSVKSTPRKPTRFRERELARAVRAAKSAGGERVEIDPASGKITVVIAPGKTETDTPEKIISKL
jgi:hypothetical protein